jgi:hypothetical protein
MERNVEIVRASKEVADGAAMLTTRCLDLAGDRTRRPQGACHLDLRVDGGTKAAQRGGAKPGQVAAWARHLAGKPRVARLRNGDQTGTILAEQHHSLLFHCAHYGDAPGRDGGGREKFRKAPGINRRAAKSPP